MPRGNDAKEALHELADRFGQGVGNAELLIDGNLAASSQRLRYAQLLPRDEEASKEARKGMSKLKGPDGERVVSVAVRGSVDSDERVKVIVYRTEAGRDLVCALDDKDKPVVNDSIYPKLGDGEAEDDPADADADAAKTAASSRSRS